MNDIVARRGLAGAGEVGMAFSNDGLHFEKDKRFRIIDLNMS